MFEDRKDKDPEMWKQELELKEKELDIRRRELEIREKELQMKMEKGKRFSNAVSTGVSAVKSGVKKVCPGDKKVCKWAVVLGVPYCVVFGMFYFVFEYCQTRFSTALEFYSCSSIFVLVGILMAVWLKKKLIG